MARLTHDPYQTLADPARVLAVLGPTNTGKTHFAVERMLAHPSGLIGFPLRLLAREIYDRIVQAKGPGAVALITGEERIQPPTARFHVATVEAMPLDLDPSFLAVDEIQLCADPERGHVFTDRLLHARGADETMFLGADTIRPLLKALVPEAQLITRPRFSTLTHVAPSKVSRLPRRSAVVAFTAPQVYALAELVRRTRGGAAVVLGALSPRTRNAQVALYQAGEVDYLIATDAIGMGLNMDLAHVALASQEKFDGREWRRLLAPEIGQIAGRAGRHMQDGTFGTTVDAGELDPRTIEAVESHSFPALKELRWRHDQLDFGSLDGLLDSLDAPPPVACLKRTAHAVDHVSLKMLTRRPEVRQRAASTSGVRLLWSVCQIPDFRKTLTDAHLELLATVFEQLSERGRLGTDWVADQVVRLDRTDGDIDTLIARLAHIRTWTYVAHRGDWLDDDRHWQERTRTVEDRLSDALHERLTQRFVDRRAQALINGLRDQSQLVEVGGDGAILVDGQAIGRVEGLCYTLEPEGSDLERRAMATAAKRVLGTEIRGRARRLVEAEDDAFRLDNQGLIRWQNATVARLLTGPTPLAPRLELLVADQLGVQARDAMRERLVAWLEGHLATVAEPLQRLQAATLNGPGRGLAFSLVEGLGNIPVEAARTMLAPLAAEDRARLTRLGVRFGVHHVYLAAMLKPRAVELRAKLWAIHQGAKGVSAPPPGRVALPATPDQPEGFAAAIGFSLLGDSLLRIDIVERLAARIRALAREGPFELVAELMAISGLSRPELATVVTALGYATNGEGRYRRRRPAPRPRNRPAVASESPFAALSALRLNG